MLGYSHAISGAMAWLLAAPVLSEVVLKTEMNPTTLAAGALVTAGAALLPDLDHPDATIAHTFGPASKAVAVFTERVSGGHRNGTHSLLFALGAGFVATVIALTGVKSAIFLLLLVFIAFALKALNLTPPVRSKPIRILTIAGVAAAISWFFVYYTTDITNWMWLGPAVLLGCVVHCVGDSLTPQRVPWLWPKKTRYGFPLIAKTGNSTEKLIIVPIMLIITAALTWSSIVKPLLGDSFQLPL